MIESQQLELVLGPETAFWEDGSQAFRLHMTDSMLIEIIEQSGKYRWKVTNPDRSGRASAQSFHSMQDAKTDLRAALKERLVSLLALKIVTNPLAPGDHFEVDEGGVIRRFKSSGPAGDAAPEQTHIRVYLSGLATFNPHVNSPLPERVLVYFEGGANMGIWGGCYQYDEEK
jgi:hypothetical protein